MLQNMDTIILSLLLAFALGGGTIVGYYIRQSIAKQRAGSLEAKLLKKVQDTKEETAKLIKEAEVKSSKILQDSQKEVDDRRREFLKAQQLILDREKLLEEKIAGFDKKEVELGQKVEVLKGEKESLDKLRQEAETKLEKVASLSREDAKKELLALVEKDSEKDIMERIKKLEQTGQDTLAIKAREIVTLAIQKCAVNHTLELSTTTIHLASEDIKGRIIGKEGRNIKTFEKITGVEVLIDDTPDSVVISCFNPVLR